MPKILLVEDDPHDVELALQGLAKENLANQVDVANDGEEALDYLYQRGLYSGRDTGTPCVILLDIKMRFVGGLDVLREIRSDPAYRSIPVVMMTSSREERDLQEAYRLGCNAYVVKPANFGSYTEAFRTAGLFWAHYNEIPELKSSGEESQARV